MKERFEGLSAWREKQKQERDFLENQLKEAQRNMESVVGQNQELSRKLADVGKAGEAPGECQVRRFS